MRAIIDADRLPTAVPYYRTYMSEPAQQLSQFIGIDWDKFSPTHHLTLLSLLQALDTTREKECMVALHSDPNGLLLPLGTGQVSKKTADKSVLNAIRLASIAFDLIDDTNNPGLAHNDSLVKAWMDFFNSVPDNVETSSVTTASGTAAKCDEALKLGQAWIAAKCKALEMTESQLRNIATLADKVRRYGINRLEFRSCRLGDGNGLQEVASFFGAWSCAPKVRTFYLQTSVHIVPNQSRLNRDAAGLAPTSRRFTSAYLPAGPTDNVAFAIEVNSLEHSKFTARLLSINTQMVFDWCCRFISRLPISMTINNVPVPQPNGNTLSQTLLVAGFWTPGTAKPFVFPLEPDYPSFLESQAA